MSIANSDATRPLRLSIYAVLIALATGSILGRILAVSSVDVLSAERQRQREGQKDWRRTRPFLSANDRSRWLTVRALVEHGTYAIDDVIQEPLWDTIDMVKHQGPDGMMHLYSSKPPLMATLMAGPYWVLHKLTGKTLGTHPYELGRTMIVLFNLVPLVLYFVLIARLAERMSDSDWARIFMVAAATFGTFLTTFAITINNHVPAAICALVALYAAIRIWYHGQRRWWYFVAAGFFGALLAASELPALSLFAALSLALLWISPKRTLLAYVPAAAVVMAASLGTNYLSHGTLSPPYAFRHASEPGMNWYDYSFEVRGREVQSYWRNPKGIDAGEQTRGKYVLHTLVGHHGIFSLTPLWLLSAAGVVFMWRDGRFRGLALAIAAVSVVTWAFYIARPLPDRNYGGMTSGLRWMFWLAPLWLVALLPAAGWLGQSRAGRGLCLVLLSWSVMSVSYPTWNPWTHPWLTNLLLHLEWIKF